MTWATTSASFPSRWASTLPRRPAPCTLTATSTPTAAARACCPVAAGAADRSFAAVRCRDGVVGLRFASRRRLPRTKFRSDRHNGDLVRATAVSAPAIALRWSGFRPTHEGWRIAMSQSPHEIANNWFEEVWNKGRLEAVEELATPDAKSYGFPQPGSVLTRAEFREYILEFRRSFTHIRIEVDETVAEGDRVAVRWTGTMQHTGSGLGFAPTGRVVTVQGMSLLHLRDGLICAGWNALDLGSVVYFLSALSARP